MDFIVNNWIWFLIGGIVLLMTIIGYIAEKTDFGRKSFGDTDTKKDNKKENKKEKIEEIEEKSTEPDVQIALATDSILENTEPVKDELGFSMPVFDTTPTVEETEQVEEDLTVPFGNVEEAVEEFEEPSVFEPTEEFESPEVFELAEEFENPNVFEPSTTEFELPDLPSQDQTTDYFDIDQSIETEVADVVEEEPEYVEETKDIVNTDIELPDLESLLNSSNVKNTTEEDDVWKF